MHPAMRTTPLRLVQWFMVISCVLSAVALAPPSIAQDTKLFRPSFQGIASQRYSYFDSHTYVFDEVTIPLTGPDSILVDDGLVQTFRIELAPLNVLLLPRMQNYDFSLLIPDNSFPLPGSPGPVAFFWPPGDNDLLRLEGDAFSSQGLALSLREYVRSELGTVRIGLFADGPATTVVAAKGSYSPLNTLEYQLDFPTDMYNNPVTSLSQAVLRITVAHPPISPGGNNTVPRAVLVIPEPSTLILALAVFIVLTIRRNWDSHMPCAQAAKTAS